MTYRDDRDADQARIEALQGELVVANKRIAELEGKNEQALVLATQNTPTTAAKRWFGAPLELEFERTFDGAFPAAKFEDLVEDIRELTRDRGRTELMKSSVAWWSSATERGIGPFLCVTLTVKDGRTILRVTDKLGQLAGAMYGGLWGGIGGGGLVAPVFATMAVPFLAPVFFGAWLGGTYALSRAIYKRSAKKRAQKLQQLFAAVERAVARELKSPVELASESREELPEKRTRQLTGETT